MTPYEQGTAHALQIFKMAGTPPPIPAAALKPPVKPPVMNLRKKIDSVLTENLKHANGPYFQPSMGGMLTSAVKNLGHAVNQGGQAGAEAFRNRVQELAASPINSALRHSEGATAAVRPALQQFHAAGGTSAMAPLAAAALAAYGGKKLYEGGQSLLHRMRGPQQHPQVSYDQGMF